MKSLDYELFTNRTFGMYMYTASRKDVLIWFDSYYSHIFLSRSQVVAGS